MQARCVGAEGAPELASMLVQLHAQGDALEEDLYQFLRSSAKLAQSHI